MHLKRLVKTLPDAPPLEKPTPAELKNEDFFRHPTAAITSLVKKNIDKINENHKIKTYTKNKETKQTKPIE